MESRTYCIPEFRRESIEKLVARHQKKADAYGIPMTVQFGEPYAKEIAIYELDRITSTRVKTGTELHEVFDLTIDSEVIRKDGYTVSAKIEHLDGGNVVSSFAPMKPEWVTIKPFCQHCNSNHGLRTTFIVRHESGSEKQVGRTCLKDYCGIDPQAIGYLNSLEEILVDEEADRCDFHEAGVAPAFSTEEVLALANLVIRKQGYRKSDESGSNKSVISEYVNKRVEPSEADKAKAKQIAEDLKAMDMDEAISAGLNNVKMLLDCGYCKWEHFGFIAWAPLAYDRHLEHLRKLREWEEAKNAERNASEYIGEIGERITVKVREAKLLTSWETQWGTTFLYKFVAESGDVLVWFASTCIDEENVRTIKGTVKEHNERDGVKQTVITRCRTAA